MRQPFALGFVMGILSALGFLTFGTPGLVILLVGVIWSVRYTSAASLSGLLIGSGATVLALVTWAAARCAAANQSGPGFVSSCTAPDSSLLITLAVVAVAAGLATGFLTIGRRRSRPSLGHKTAT
ncbi:MAG TPA: hypothetical protein VF965_06285 [Candidatus Limnocylindria bacterium]